MQKLEEITFIHIKMFTNHVTKKLYAFHQFQEIFNQKTTKKHESFHILTQENIQIF